MYTITRCQMRERGERKFGILDLFDMDSGATARVIVSESYMDKLNKAVSDGKELHVGYDSRRKCQFVYAK